MIHLDRNHHPSPISMHSNPNLILPTTHTDQHKLLSRTPLTRDDKPLHQEHQEHSSNTSVEPDVTYLPAPPLNDAVSVDETVKSHSSAPSPRAETPGQRSSSLTPPPESVSPKLTSPPAEKTASVEEHAAETEASQHSTPLSELSPAPDDSFEDDTKDDLDATEVSSSQNRVAGTDGSNNTGGMSEIKEEEKKEDLSMESASAQQKLQSTMSPRSLSTTSTLISPRPLAETDGKLASSPERMSTTTTTAARTIPSKSPVKSPVTDFMLSQDPRAVSRQPSITNSSSRGTPAPSMDKAARLLELNGELLKVCMEFQARNITMIDQRFQQYFTRLQANLTWLANAADSNRQGHPSNMTLPFMEPPVSVDFISMERIHQLYADLPSMFAKEIARRQQMGITHKAPSMSSIPSNLSLKRDRPDDIEASIANKRRDTGESKSPPMRNPATPPPLSIITPPSATFPMSINDSAGHTNLSAIQPMASIAPPLLPQGMIAGPQTEAQLAASTRERNRQMQIQEARLRQQQQLNARQMSPPSAPAAAQEQGQINNAGSLPMLNLAALGPNAVQSYQVLQNTSHPITQYMNHTVPGFSTLPVREQLQRMQVVQSAAQQKQQNQQMPGQRVPMPGMVQQQPIQPMQNTGMRAPQYSGQNTGVTSPTSSQSSAAQQQQSPSNGVFPFAQNQSNTGANVANSQMMGTMNFNNQQRQFLLLQHQQQMRTASGNMNPAMMASDQYAMAQERSRQEQQRMSQATSPTNAGSPLMSASGNDANTFPVLRSNTVVPGISRSTLSPSDGTPTPMSPQMRGSMPMQDMRRMVNPAVAGGMGGQMMGGQIPGFNQQMANWQQKNQSQQPSIPMGHLQPPNYGVQPFVAGGNSFGNAVPNQTWPNQYSLAPSLNSGGYQQLEQTRQSSSTPAPQQFSVNSPPAQHTSLGDLETFHWGVQ